MVLIQYKEGIDEEGGERHNEGGAEGAEVLSGIRIGKLSSLFNTIENGPGNAAGENRLPKR